MRISKEKSQDYLVTIEVISSCKEAVSKSIRNELDLGILEPSSIKSVTEVHFNTRREAYQFFDTWARKAEEQGGDYEETRNYLYAHFSDMEEYSIKMRKWDDFYRLEKVVNFGTDEGRKSLPF